MPPRGAQKVEKDGAKPGAELVTGAERYAFNADGRASAREHANVTIGEAVFHRRRKNWQVTRELRTLLRAQEKAGGRALRLRAQIDALTEKVRGVRDPLTDEWLKPPLTDEREIAQIDEQVDELDGKVDAALAESDEAAYQIIALLLRDDQDSHPDLDHLKEHLDVEDAGDLAASLAGGGEPTPDPTTTGTSSE